MNTDTVTQSDAMVALDALFVAEMTGAMSCSGSNGVAIWTAYLALSAPDIYFTSQKSTTHVRAIRQGGDCAVALWSRPTVWGGALCGAQLYGSCVEVVDLGVAGEGLSALHRRFPGTQETLPDVAAVHGPDKKTCLLRFRFTGGKIVDEERFGARTFAKFEVDGVDGTP